MAKLKELIKSFLLFLKYCFEGDLTPNPLMEEIDEPIIVPNEEVIYKVSNQELVSASAKSAIGQDASPDDLVPDDVACVESLSNILRQVYPDFPILTGTANLSVFLYKDGRFKATIEELQSGFIVVCPTGKGNGTIVGHCWIAIELNGKLVLASNNSFTGKWEITDTLDSIIKRYRRIGGLPLYYYKPL